MKRKIIYIFTLFLLFFTFNLKVHATDYTDFTGKYVLTMPDYDFSQFLIDDTHTFQDFLDSFVSIANNSQTYYAIITTDTLYTRNTRYFDIYLIPKSENISNISTFFGSSYSSTNYFYSFYTPSINYSLYQSFLFSDNSYHPFGSDFYSSSYYLNLVSCLNGDTCNFTFSTQNLSSRARLANSIYLNNQFAFIDYGSSSTFYALTAFGTSLIYYSSLPINFQYNGGISGNNNYIKSLKINGVDYSVGDRIPTYCELYDLCTTSDSTFIEFKSSLDTIYTSFSPSDISNFELNIDFDTHDITALDYDMNLDYVWNCYGRINHNNDYYSYVQFPYCDFENNGDYVSDSNSLNIKFNNFNIYDSNDNIISDFSSYDKLYFYVNFQYRNSELNRVVSNMSINFNGLVYYSDDFRGPIYERFINLPTGFKMFFSTTKNDYSNFYGRFVTTSPGSLFSIYRQEYNTSTLNTNSIYGWLTDNLIRYSVNNRLNIGLMFYQNENSLDESSLYYLEFFIFPDIIISLNDNSNNNFYYSNSSGVIVNNNFVIDYSNISSDNYDLSYYLNQVDSFIDELSSSSLQFSNITQEFYDSLPSIFQIFIFVVFILFCLYFTFLLIKRK